MSTFNQLQDDTLDLCQEIAAQTDFTMTKVKRQINRGYYDFVKRTACIQDVIDITTVADQESYTASDAANLAYVYKPWLVRYIEYDEDAGSLVDERGDVLKPYHGGVSALPDVKYTGTPTHYWTRGVHTRGEFEIGTSPICSSSDRVIRVYAFMFPTADLSSDSDQPLMKEAWQDALVNYAVWKLHLPYVHLNKAWHQKAMEHKYYYEEDVATANENMLTETFDDFSQVVDVYNV